MLSMLYALDGIESMFTECLKPALKSVIDAGVPFTLALAVYGFEEPNFDDLERMVRIKKRGFSSRRAYKKLENAANKAGWAIWGHYTADKVRGMLSGKLRDTFYDPRYKTAQIEPNLIMGLAFMKDYSLLNEYYVTWVERHGMRVTAEDEAMIMRYLTALVEFACFVIDYAAE